MLAVVACGAAPTAGVSPGAAATPSDKQLYPPKNIHPPSIVQPCGVFPSNSIFNKDISSLPVNPNSSTWLGSMNAATTNLHPDFGAYPYGIPYNTVTPSHSSGTVTFQYSSESDPSPYIVGSDLLIEGTPNDGGDDHMLAYDPTDCSLQEIWHAQLAVQPYTGGAGAKWDLRSNALRPVGWTSADAAGLPIFPLLVRYAEVQNGAIHHAIRFTVACTNSAYIWPARHQAGSCGANYPPMGARFRLKSAYNISGFSQQAQVILSAMQHYGMFVADNGSDWYFQGDENAGWTDPVLSELKTVPASQFEAVDESSLMVDPNSGQST